MTTYANRVTTKYRELLAARGAGAPLIDFLSGTIVVGDAGAAGAPPSLSDLIAANGVLHEVWRGAAVVSCEQNASDDTQIDIGVVIPAAVSGAEVGPFQINEFALLNEAGECLVVGQMNFYKGTAATGLPGDLAFIVQIGASATNVVISPPGSSIFITDVDVRNRINAHQPTGEGAILTDTTVAGWLRRVFTLRKARQPSAVVGAVVAEQDAFGGGRPATDAEFEAGEAAPGSWFTWPWPTLAQVKNAIGDISVYGALFPLVKNAAAKRYEIANATVGAVGAVRLATSAEVLARATSPTGGGPCAVRPEDIPVASDPWGVGLGAAVTVPMQAPAPNTVGGGLAALMGQSIAGNKFVTGHMFVALGATLPPCQGATLAVYWDDARRALFDASQTWTVVMLRQTYYRPADPYNGEAGMFAVTFRRTA